MKAFSGIIHRPCLTVILCLLGGEGMVMGDSFVQFPDGPAAWTVNITQISASSVPKKHAKSVDVIQSQDFKKIIISWDDGSTTEEWGVPNLPVTFKQYPNGEVFTVPHGRVEDINDNFDMPTDASAFIWMNAGSLQEKDPISYLGKQCYHYRGVAVAQLPVGGVTLSSKRESWIDAKTLLPVEIDTEDSHCIFTFKATPSEPLNVPAKFKKEITYYKRNMGYR